MFKNRWTIVGLIAFALAFLGMVSVRTWTAAPSIVKPSINAIEERQDRNLPSAMGDALLFSEQSDDPLIAEAESGINDTTNQRMYTYAVLHRAGPLAGRLDVNTRTWTTVMLRGFTGGVYIKLRNANNELIGVTNLQTYGVDGTWVVVRPSRRDEWWYHDFDSTTAANATKLEIVHEYAPKNRLLPILEEIGRVLKSVGETVCRLDQERCTTTGGSSMDE